MQLQLIAPTLVHTRHALLDTITDLAPVQTQLTRITCVCFIADDVTMQLNILLVVQTLTQLPSCTGIKSIIGSQLILAVSTERTTSSTFTDDVVMLGDILQVSQIVFDFVDARSPLMNDRADVVAMC
jgi:hypothetical protein